MTEVKEELQQEKKLVAVTQEKGAIYEGGSTENNASKEVKEAPGQQSTESETTPKRQANGELMVNTEEKVEAPKETVVELVEETDKDCDLSEPGLLKEEQGFFSLMKHGKRAICPYKPERVEQQYARNTKTGKDEFLGQKTIPPSCNSTCPMFRFTKDNGNYGVSISCGTEDVLYNIPQDKLVLPAPKKEVEDKSKPVRKLDLKK